MTNETSETERLPLDQFIRLQGIVIDNYVKTDRRPDTGPDERPMDHWRVTLRNGGGKRMMLVFSKGLGLKGKPPTLNEVVSALASDSEAVESNPTWEEFAREFCYDPDSRSAHRTFRACQRQSRKLLDFVGELAYKRLLWETDRD